MYVRCGEEWSIPGTYTSHLAPFSDGDGDSDVEPGMAELERSVVYESNVVDLGL